MPGFWAEATNLALAETLRHYWQAWDFTSVKEVEDEVPIAFNV
jgi:hypothetical protein